MVDKMKSYIIPFVFLVAVITGCKSDSVEERNLICIVPDTVSYRNDVQPILTDRCANCHFDATIGSFTDYIATTNAISNSTVDDFKMRITHSDSISASKWMPLDAAKMDDCSIEKILRWIDQGMNDN
jgi:hypothetical protein